MLERITRLSEEIADFQSADPAAIERFRIQVLGKKGAVNELFRAFKAVPKDQKKILGQRLNELRDKAREKLVTLQAALEAHAVDSPKIDDLTKPGIPVCLGSRHPISLVQNQIIRIFSRMGFGVAQGPEIEDDWHNFTALNLPAHHPARDMQDTFFIEKNPDRLLRTHTSSVQIRYMEQHEPPIRILAPGRVYRNETIAAHSHFQFHQVEGLYVDKGVSFADLKQTLQFFAKSLFGKSKIRLRPSYFPFTEPSAEVDVYWGLNSEADHRITKGTGWLEIMGCGMVDPNVLENTNIDPKTHSGFAFGMGIERIAMLRYQIDDIRLFFENDVRFLSQFASESQTPIPK